MYTYERGVSHGVRQCLLLFTSTLSLSLSLSHTHTHTHIHTHIHMQTTSYNYPFPFWCPEHCSGPHVYCPMGSGSPRAVSTGYYTYGPVTTTSLSALDRSQVTVSPEVEELDNDGSIQVYPSVRTSLLSSTQLHSAPLSSPCNCMHGQY